MKQERRPLVITGAYRSGTTLLQKMLDAHPDCAVAAQPALPIFRIFRDILHRSGMPVSDPAGALGISFKAPAGTLDTAMKLTQAGPDDIANMNRDVARLTQSLRDSGTDDAFPKSYEDALRQHLSPGSLLHVFECLLDALEDYRFRGQPRHWLGFKDLYLEELLHPLLVASSDLRVIHIVRDPRAVLASRNFGRYADAYKGPRLHPLLYVARLWQTSVQWRQVLRARNAGRVLALHYEWVSRDLVKAAEEIGAFLGLEKAHVMADERNWRNESGGVWTGNSSHGGAHEEKPRWQSLVPTEAIGALEFLCRDEMEAEGYSPSQSPDQQLHAFRAYTEAEADLLPWTRQPGLILDEREKRRLLEFRRTTGSAPE